jgi:CRP/FNR family transcriptional regulator, cyclic AMP receptor protein
VLETARWVYERGKVRQRGQNGKQHHFPAGTKIFSPDHPTYRIYRLNSGRVQLRNGPEAIVDQLLPGDFFGEKYFLAPYPGDQDATALEPVEATAYRRLEVLHSLRTDPRFAGEFVKNLAFRLDRYENALRDFVTEPAERRLARLLLRFMPARPASGWIRLQLRATNLELAGMVGMTRWRVSHFLNHFQRLGWLSRRRQQLLIYYEGLREFLESPPRPDVRRPTGQKRAAGS